MSHLAELVASAKAAISQASDVAALDNVRVEYLGKKGHLTLQMTTCVSCRQKSVRQLVRLSTKRKSRFSRR
ncbi:phenylalanyl-tRNA synthetase subunit alpha [Escherichia coli]|uniref:Phenylalanyl-tRNA synthetase subunit alpha n=1 Tax=Escherichia coli TaxID=562 RepID=A0A377CIG5_ECOLX|nr:phenylalanyl-tRNA synthetase subunit alpha [Escherichia coli]